MVEGSRVRPEDLLRQMSPNSWQALSENQEHKIGIII